MNLDKFLGCMYGVAIGDALGMPFEGMTAHDIRNQNSYVTEYKSPKFNPLRSFSTTHLPSGSWTDDTQLTLAVMRALTKAKGFDMDTIVGEHIKEYKTVRRNWGPSTRKSCERLVHGCDWRKSGEKNGAGNGVMMKIAPLGLLRSVVVEDMGIFVENCIDFARMTHLATPAIVAGVAHAFTIASLAGRRDQKVEVFSFLQALHDLTVLLEDDLERDLPVEKKWNSQDQISSQIVAVADYLESGKRGEEDPYDLEQLGLNFFGGTSYAPASFGMSYALFFKSCLTPNNPMPFRAVFDAVNAGGDTDTNASIVGSLVGALYGTRAIPPELARNVEDDGEIRNLTTEFYYMCDQLRYKQSGHRI